MENKMNLQESIRNDLNKLDEEMNENSSISHKSVSCLKNLASDYKKYHEEQQEENDPSDIYAQDARDILYIAASIENGDIDEYLGDSIRALDTAVRDAVLFCIDVKYWDQLGFTE